MKNAKMLLHKAFKKTQAYPAVYRVFFESLMQRQISVHHRKKSLNSGKNIYYEVDMKYAGEMVDIRYPVDETNRFFLFHKGQAVQELKPVDLVANANPPYISTSFSKLLQNDEDR